MREQIVSQGVKMSRHAILQCTHANKDTVDKYFANYIKDFCSKITEQGRLIFIFLRNARSDRILQM